MISPLGYLRYRRLLFGVQPSRYANLFRTIYKHDRRHLVEIGCWNGVHGKKMIETAMIKHRPNEVVYHGFDLFEDLSEEMYEREFSKWPPPMEHVQDRLVSTGAHINLHKGNTRSTLPEVLEEMCDADFVFIDGGHSEETIACDWSYVERFMNRDTIVIFDDYYQNEDAEVRQLGCRTLIESLDPACYEVKLLQPTDKFIKPWGVLKINMVRVTLNKDRPPGFQSRRPSARA